MSSLPGSGPLDFAKMEEEICERWQREQTFKMQDKLSLERGDEVCYVCSEQMPSEQRRPT